MKNRWLIIAVLFPLLSFSQDKKGKAHINTTASVGLIAGESTAKPLFQLGTGLKFSRWYTGVGVGLDPYRFRSIPFFADGRVGLGKMQLAFLYLNGGYNIPYDIKANYDEEFFKTGDTFKGGFYMDAGIGYRQALKNSLHRLLFSVGYSRKDIVNTVEYTYPCLTPPCPVDIYRYQYNLGRIVTKISWEFGR